MFGVLALIAAAVVWSQTRGQDVGRATTTSAVSPPTAAAPHSSTASTAPAAEPSSTTLPPCDRAAVVRSWPLARRLGQVLMPGIAGSDGSLASARAAVAQGVGGLFVRRPGDAALASGGLVGLSTPDAVPVSVAIDDEGGRVQTLRSLAGDLPSARVLARLGPDAIHDLYEERGQRMRALGVTVDFAPVVDVSAQEDDDVIGDRSFAADPDTVVADAEAAVRGLQDAGIAPVLKHFPGHGRASGDSHEGVAITPSFDQLDDDLEPYERLAPLVTWIMVGHLSVPGLTDGAPASLSPAAIDGLLRGSLGYQGVVVSDELGGMRAIADHHPLPEAVRLFLLAGGDVALWNGADRVGEVLAALEADVTAGRLPEDVVDRAALRVLDAKGYDPCASPGTGSPGPT